MSASATAAAHHLLAVSAAAVLVLFSAATVIAAPPQSAGKSPDELPAVADLPDPFTFNDGSKVKTRDDWARRRGELLELIQTYEYGHLPPDPKNTKVFELVNGGVVSLTGAGAHRQYRVVCGPEAKPVQFILDLTLPKGKGPFPVILRGDWGWHKTSDEITAEVIKRGYALADYNRVEVAPDNKGRETGIYLAYPDGDYGAVAAWAWGFHRAVDALETMDFIDKSRIAITGHSRGGKAVILAGATDPRIALTAPNDSGCGGCGSLKHQAPKSEDIAAITKNFPFWFTPLFKEFAGKQEKLPIDQHFVKALVAPRAFLETEALADLWANPEGSRLTFGAAKEVYTFLGAPDRIAIAYREGGHNHMLSDWQALLDFADQVFFNKKPQAERDWNANPFPQAPKGYTWTAPAAQ